MTDFVEIFCDEVEASLKEATRLTLAMEAGEPGREHTEALMRVFHSLKGAARAMQFDAERETAHLLEDVYHDLLAGDAPYRPALIDLSLQAIDLFRAQVKARLAEQALPDASGLREQMRRYRAGEPLAADATAPQTAVLAATGEGPRARAPETQADGTGADAADSRPEIPAAAEAPEDAALEPSAAGSTAPRAPVADPEHSPAASQSPPRRRASLEYEQLDRLHRLSGELTVSVGAMAGQRNRVRRLARELDRASRQLGRIGAGQRDDRDQNGGEESLYELLRPVIERLASIGGGLEALNQVHDRTEGQLQQLAEHLADEVTQARLVPLTELLDDCPRIVRDLARDLGKQVALRVEGDQNRIDRAVLEALRNPLLHLVRNALDHGIEAPEERRALGKAAAGRLAIEAQQLGSMMRIRVVDDGAGIDLERLRETVVSSGRTTEPLWQAMGVEEQLQFLFLPGLSTTTSVSDTSGRGFGLDIVKSALDAMGGRIGVHSERGQGCCVELQVPLSLALTRCLLVRGGRHPLFGVQRYAIPMPEVVSVMRLDPARLRRVEGWPAVHLDEGTLPLYELSQLLALAPLTTDTAEKHLLVLGDHERRAAVLVEAVIDELDLVTRPLDERLGKVQQTAGVTLLDDGGLALVLDVPDLLECLDAGAIQPREAPPEQSEPVSHILVVEDSVTVREVERHFLTQAGYEVTTAVNGVDGLNKAKAGRFDMVITDIDMPRMNGIELIRTLRGLERFRRLPVIVVSYKDRPEDREAALGVGASHYVTKAEFDTDAMLATVAELLAGAEAREAAQGVDR